MNDSLIEALDRTGKHDKTKQNGFVLGVIHGDGFENGKPIKFDMAVLQKIINKHGSRAKIWVQIGNDKKIGVIKEIQKEPVSGKIRHIDIQLVSMEHDLKIKIPIIFHGKNSLESRKLILQVFKSEINISGNPQSIPESVVVNLEGKGVNYSVTLKDIHLDSNVIVHEPDSEVFAIIAEVRGEIESHKEEVPVEIQKEKVEPVKK